MAPNKTTSAACTLCTDHTPDWCDIPQPTDPTPWEKMVCTRPKGHEGPHVACVTGEEHPANHSLETWANTPTVADVLYRAYEDVEMGEPPNVHAAISKVVATLVPEDDTQTRLDLYYKACDIVAEQHPGHPTTPLEVKRALQEAALHAAANEPATCILVAANKTDAERWIKDHTEDTPWGNVRHPLQRHPVDVDGNKRIVAVATPGWTTPARGLRVDRIVLTERARREPWEEIQRVLNDIDPCPL